MSPYSKQNKKKQQKGVQRRGVVLQCVKMVFSLRVLLVVVNSILSPEQVWGDSRREGST